MPKKKAPWVRAIINDSDTAHSGSSAGVDDQSSPKTTPQDGKAEGDKAAVGHVGDEDPEARGSKNMVLKDLARERDKRQEAEQQRDEFKAKLDEIERSKMSDHEKTVADRDQALARIAELEKQIADGEAASKRREAVAGALAATKLPAEMAERLRGETAEEIMEDAKALAKTIGFDRSALDPSQGQNAAGKSQTNSLSSALRAHFNA
ncbi:hypothetical protein [Corynebacterium silvaticum]|uniref:Scaffolding protein n=1 Tax=Corynebacterium silvaticum TaxID=2320431 RepID=A0A7Y4PA17_9CORY|nr:hypothetical protein [Corynebacterium silvaticum]ARU45319.1 hypothetical protein CBE74_00970 [Corynebacterium silvaticum]NON70984.1 hypothetical protein [Corynebacterium silvaticum]UWH00425.1 hypothetical protein K1I39_00955 [Corynebacterium silvaticum]UWH02472.1 hypothetical protein K1I38_00960 [Corynebacterium silvaticum]UWH04509.1 hypothetical protein K1I36_00965 [Corynebacterium silvaticum]